MIEQEQPRRRGRPPLTPEQRAAREAQHQGRGEMFMDATDAYKELQRLRELVAWIGPHIRQRAANMSWMTKACMLCTRTKLRRENCRHDEIWAVADANSGPEMEITSMERAVAEEAAD